MFNQLGISGVYEVSNFHAEDKRGCFVKTYHQELFREIEFNGQFAESYYSTSSQNVIRGMHFQTPPYDHQKLVYVTHGEILDIILDLRKTSPTYGKSASLRLKQYGSSVFIPKGCAHGFLTISQSATVVYNVSTVYEPKADQGILWNSFGFDWGLIEPIMSIRDSNFESFQNFKTQFD